MARQRLLSVGKQFPEFRLPLLAGGEATLADIAAGGPVLLAFFKVSCPVCQLTLPFLERLHASDALAIYGVSQNGAEDTREFNRSFRINFPVLLDQEEADFPLSNACGISTVPTLLLVEPGGKVSSVQEGFVRREMEALGARAGASLFRPGDYVPEWQSG